MNNWAVKFADEDNSTENSREQLLSIEAEAQKIEALRQQISEALMAEGIPPNTDIEVGMLSPELQAEIDAMSEEMADGLLRMFASGIDEEVLMEQYGEQIAGAISDLIRNKAASKKLQKKMQELMSVLDAVRQRLNSKIASESLSSHQALRSLKLLNQLTTRFRESLQQIAEKNGRNLNIKESSRLSAQSQQSLAMQLRQSLLKGLEAMKSIDARLKQMQQQLQNADKNSERAIKAQLKAIREQLKTANPEQQAALRQQQAQLREQLARVREQNLQRQLDNVQKAMKNAGPEQLAALRQQQSVLQQQLKANQTEQAIRQQMRSLQEAMKKAGPEQQAALRQQMNQLKQQLNAQMREQAQLKIQNMQAKQGVLQARLNQLNEAMKSARPEQLQAMQRQQQLLQSKLDQNLLRLNERALKSQLKEVNDALKKANPEQREALMQMQARLKSQLDANRQQQEASRQQINALRQSQIQERMARLSKAMETASPDKLQAMQRQMQQLQSKLTEQQLRSSIKDIDKQLKSASPERTVELQAERTRLQKELTSRQPGLKVDEFLRTINQSRVANLAAAKDIVSLLETSRRSGQPLSLNQANIKLLQNNIAQITEAANRSGDKQMIKDALQLSRMVQEAVKLDKQQSYGVSNAHGNPSNLHKMGEGKESGFISNMKKNFLESDALKAIKEKFGDKKPSSVCDNCNGTKGCCGGKETFGDKFKKVVGHIRISKETPEKQAEIKDKIADQRKVSNVIQQGADKFKKGLSNFGNFLKNKRTEIESGQDSQEVEAKAQQDAARRARTGSKFGSGSKPPPNAKPEGEQKQAGAGAGQGR